MVINIIEVYSFPYGNHNSLYHYISNDMLREIHKSYKGLVNPPLFVLSNRNNSKIQINTPTKSIHRNYYISAWPSELAYNQSQPPTNQHSTKQ